MRLITASECRKIAANFAKNHHLYGRITDEVTHAALLGELKANIDFDSFEDSTEAERILLALGFDILGTSVKYDEKNKTYELYVSWKK